MVSQQRSLPTKSYVPIAAGNEGASAAEKGAQVRHLVGNLAGVVAPSLTFGQTHPMNIKVISYD